MKISISRIYIWLFALILSAVSIVSGAEESAKKALTAIIGEGNFADAIFLELNEAEPIELLERAQFSAIEKEFALDRINAKMLKERFPHVQFFVIATPGDVVVFDAVNGCRLAEMLIDENDVERFSEIGKVIANAAKQKSRDFAGLGIVAVINNGVPKRYLPEMQNFLKKIMSRMIEEPQIMLMERSNLGMVRQERMISDLAFPLPSSMSLLRIEFTPGAEAQIVNCTIRVVDKEGKLLEKYCEENIFARETESLNLFLEKFKSMAHSVDSQPDTSEELVPYTCFIIGDNPAYAWSFLEGIAREDRKLYPCSDQEAVEMVTVEEEARRKEAQRFFDRFWSQVQAGFVSNREDLETALSLYPGNVRFQFEELRETFKDLTKATQETYMDRLNLFVKKLETFAAKKQGLYTLRSYSGEFGIPHRQFPQIHYGNEWRLPAVTTDKPQIDEQLRYAAATIREIMLRSYEKEWQKIPLTQSGLERRISAIQTFYLSGTWCYDVQELERKAPEGLNRLLTLLETLPADHPAVAKLEDQVNLSGTLCNEWLWLQTNPKVLYTAIAQASTSQLPAIRALGAKWKFMQTLDQLDNCDEERFRREAEVFYNELKTIFGDQFSRYALTYTPDMTLVQSIYDLRAKFTDVPEVEVRNNVSLPQERSTAILKEVRERQLETMPASNGN